MAGAVAFAIYELRHHDPFIDLRVLSGNGPLLLTYGRALLAYVVSYSLLYGFTQWLQDGRGLSAGHAGLVMTPLFVAAIAVTFATGRRQAVRGKLIAGSTAQIIACALMLTLGPSSSIWILVLVLLIFGIPQGLNSLALQTSVYRQADPATIGASAGLLRTFGYLGAITASAAVGGFYKETADTGGMHHLAVFLIVISATLLVITATDRSLKKITTTEEVHHD